MLDIHWNTPTDSCATFTHFNLYGRDNPLSLFQMLGSYNNVSINSLNIKLKNIRNWEFYLVYQTACNGTDSIFSDTIRIDKVAPPNSEIDSVSVDLASQKTVIGWTENTADDIMGYNVYYVTSTNSIIETTSSLEYQDNDAGRNPAQASQKYGIAAFDSCGNTSLISSPHSTIHLSSVYNECTKTISLSWTPYIGWPIQEYEIYLRINNGGFSKIGTVIPNINQFTYNFLKFGDTYCFYVRARKESSSISSSSNLVCNSANTIFPSDNSYIAKASVIRESVELVCVVQPGSSAQKINIYKKVDNGSFGLWRTEPLTNPAAGQTLRFMDEDVSVHSRNYTYYFTTEGPCNLIFDTSQSSKTILLHLTMAEPGDQTLNWNLYNDFIKATDRQQVLLIDDPISDYGSTWNILSTSNNSLVTYQDFTTLSIDQQQICYCLRAIENSAFAPYNRMDTSYSNVECVTADPLVFFPNAIQINGFNTVFYPKGVFIDYSQSYFLVYDRWGQILYETTDIRVGWDGTVNGEFVQSDVYAYKAVIVGLNGKILYFDGTITVLK